MLHTRQTFPLGCSVAAQLVRDEDAWHVPAALEQFAEDLLRCTLVPSALRQDIQHVALLVNCPPQVVPLPVDLEEDFIQMPLVPGPCAPPT